MYTKFGIFIGKNRRFGGPPGVSGLQTMLRVGGAQFARLHNERNQARGKRQKEEWIS